MLQVGAPPPGDASAAAPPPEGINLSKPAPAAAAVHRPPAPPRADPVIGPLSGVGGPSAVAPIARGHANGSANGFIAHPALYDTSQSDGAAGLGGAGFGGRVLHEKAAAQTNGNHPPHPGITPPAPTVPRNGPVSIRPPPQTVKPPPTVTLSHLAQAGGVFQQGPGVAWAGAAVDRAGPAAVPPQRPTPPAHPTWAWGFDLAAAPATSVAVSGGVPHKLRPTVPTAVPTTEMVWKPAASQPGSTKYTAQGVSRASAMAPLGPAHWAPTPFQYIPTVRNVVGPTVTAAMHTSDMRFGPGPVGEAAPHTVRGGGPIYSTAAAAAATTTTTIAAATVTTSRSLENPPRPISLSPLSREVLAENFDSDVMAAFTGPGPTEHNMAPSDVPEIALGDPEGEAVPPMTVEGEIAVQDPGDKKPRRSSSGGGGKRKRKSDGGDKKEGEKKKRKKKKDPNKPKAPVSAFILWFRHHNAALKAQYPTQLIDVPVSDMMRFASQLWGAVSPEEQKPFQDMHAENRAAYKAAMASYVPPPPSPELPKPKSKRSLVKSVAKVACGDRSAAVPGLVFEWGMSDFIDYLDRWDLSGVYRQAALDEYAKRWDDPAILTYEETANRCQQCKARFKTPLALTVHTGTHVAPGSVTQCKLCGEKFASADILREHEDAVHAETDAVDYVATVLAWATAKELNNETPFE